MGKKLTTEQFIEEANIIHNFKYDYSLVNYKNSKTKIKIICSKHGIFEQTPGSHLNGRGCPACANNQRKTTEQFIKEANKIHNFKYDYSLVNYVNSYAKIKIICLKHGVFEQTPHDHLKGQGCYICNGGVKLSTEEFIQKAKDIYDNKYDYSLVNYANEKTKVEIKCNKCKNIFWQKPNDHLQNYGCPYCNSSKGEEIIFQYLKENNINFKYQMTYPDLKDKNKLSYDFYISPLNLLIEYNGIQHYKAIDYFGGVTYFHIQKHHDWLKRKYAKNHNIKLLTIPYWECDNIKEILKGIINENT